MEDMEYEESEDFHVMEVYSGEDIEMDYEDIDCEDCGLKFFVSVPIKLPCPTKCPRCVKGLPPPYEY